jgi:hypothetical protein
MEDSMDNDNVIPFPIPFGYHETSENIPTQRVLDGIKDNNLETVIILGYTDDGEEYFASSVADGGSILWLIERLKKRLLEAPDYEY